MTSPVAAEAALRVDFYVLASASEEGRLRVACRLCEKAYLAGQRVAVLASDPAELRRLDELLWTFAEGSFVPHEIEDGAASTSAECPVVLIAGAAPPGEVEVLVNLGSEVPAVGSGLRRIAEVIDAEEGRRAAGRRRFRHYRSLGIEPKSHDLGASTPL
jgi:DNA polymerase-3 subunit chi